MQSDRLLKFGRTLSIAILVVASSFAALPPAFTQVSILTNKFDNSRDGANTSETLLTDTTVNVNQFGKLFAFNVDGYVIAQPLYMYGLSINGGTHNVVFVATQHDSVFAIDADSGVQLWQTSFIDAAAGITTVPSKAEGCTNIIGFDELGITSTPVIDPNTGTLYVTAKTQEIVAAKYTYVYRLHALDVTTGFEKFGGPVVITGQVGTLSFVTLNQMQRMGLLLSNGNVIIGSGSNGCDLHARGWLFAYNASNLQQVAQMTTQPDQSYGSSLWQGGVGPAVDSNGNIFLATANGLFNYSGFDYGDSVLKFSLGTDSFNLEDYFTPFDQATLAVNDTDLGSGGPTLLPPQAGSTTPNLLVTSGKPMDIYLINRDSLGGYNMTSNSQIVQYIPDALSGELFGSPVYWNNMVYFLAHQDYLKGYSLTTNGSGVTSLSTTPIIQTPSKLSNIGFPVLSANGTSNGMLWLVRSVQGVSLLSAYDANRLALVYDSSMAAGNRDSLGTIGHNATPIVANGKVYAGTQTQLVAYGLFQTINPSAGNNQTGFVGTTLPVAITVVAKNPYTGLAVPGVTVTFGDGGKLGTFGTATAVTDSNGVASSTYTLPTLPQTITITVSSSGYAPATFTEQASAGPVSVMSFVSGTKQIGTVGTTLPLPLVVKTKDAFGNLVTNASVSFTDGVGGTFNPNPAVTGVNGEATTSYTLPTVAKSLSVTASVGSVSVKCAEQANAGPATAINIVQGNNQTAKHGTRLPQALIVSVTDKYSNGISGLTVTFTDNGSGGTFSTTMPVTNVNGQATVTYTTPANAGTVTITASYSSLSPRVFTETVN